ncbi:endonuclease/exonuclease/phosphatase family protein [Acanthopleuribacter pedis]|uniref:Endonuclease/exonuclease/phosphatase family protein n=1 Tax=Acanthopleuribacter pedis TaxID=442870 RepID=A0A8J7QA92_9BACT|nr:endonuclease/exonuclease/phosphatase family protein [Acanthopleuribacter pedis]MBO1322822.1 endonuclease/exonuclease/phosphatase family protein [Acanthopleuribacter pedis]
MKPSRFSFNATLVFLFWFLFSMTGALHAQTQQLKVMTFNIWVGGTRVDFNQIIEAVRVADADIVGVQENGGNLARLADALGFYTQSRNQIISRYPIIADLPGGALIQVDGSAVAVYNVHLTPYPYGPYDLRDGASVADVLANEQSRHMNEMASLFTEIENRMAAGTPVFLTGDFNVPSHLDWTAEVADRHFGYTVDWPVSKRLEAMGVHDAFRRANPDVRNRPGYTWTPGYPPPVLEHDEKHDRIDFVYYAGDRLALQGAQTLGHDANNSNTDIAVTPWGSDHRAVVATFTLRHATDVPRVVPQKATFESGDTVTVDFSGAAGNATDWVGLFQAGTPNGPGNSLAWLYTDGTQSGTAGIREGRLQFDALPLGNYEMRLFFNDGYDQVAGADFRVVAPTPAGVVAEHALYGVNQPIRVTYAGGSGDPRDWIDLENTDGTRLAWRYTDSAESRGSVTFAEGLDQAGVYQLHLYCCDAFTQIGAADRIEVTAAPTLFLETSLQAAEQPIVVLFLNGSGNSRDWVGLYRKNASDRRFLTWQYTAGLRHGSLSFAGLAAGEYEARFFFANSYLREARIAFTVNN